MIKYKCLNCGAPLADEEERLACSGCDTSWGKTDGIACFDKTDYWGEIPKEKLQNMIDRASEENWQEIVRTSFGNENSDMLAYITDLNRACWKSLIPVGPESVVLDIGAGLGAITHSLAHHYRKVVAVEAVPERIKFLNVRAKQEGLNNVDLVQTTAQKLPFFNKTFDLIILNGILEWIGEWDTLFAPREAQLRFLIKVHDLLKPGGVILVGIENRIGFSSLLGRVDHSGFKYTSLLPRKLASLYLRFRSSYVYRMKLNKEKEYRTYTYSQMGYDKLLSEAGFVGREYFYPVDGYNLPHVMLPLRRPSEINSYVNQQILNANRRFGKTCTRRIKKFVANIGLLKYIVSDFVIIAEKIYKSSQDVSSSEAEEKEWPRPCILGRIAEAVQDYFHLKSSRRFAYSLYSQPFKNKAVIKVGYTDGQDLAFSKITNKCVDGYATYSRAHSLLESLRKACVDYPSIINALPKPIGSFDLGNVSVAVESAVSGVPLSAIVWKADTALEKELIGTIFEVLADWFIDFINVTRKITCKDQFCTLSGSLLLPPSFVDMKVPKPNCPAYTEFMQHGDFCVDNVFWQSTDNSIAVIDWDSVGIGYPPLFDFFCLLSEFFYLDNSRRSKMENSVELRSFKDTFFENNWFSKLVKEVCIKVCSRTGIDSRLLSVYFSEFLFARYHIFSSQGNAKGKLEQKLIYEEYIWYYVAHHEECILNSK